MKVKVIWLFFMLFACTTACVEWTLIDKPVVFGKTAKLSCLLENDAGNFSTRTWTGGKDFSTLSYQGVSTNKEKYGELAKVNGNRKKFESILEIFRFDENDVNCDYSCTIGLHENKKKLELKEGDFELHPTSETALVLATLGGGHLEVIIRLTKVFPAPICNIMFNEHEIKDRIFSRTGMNGIFFKITERFLHSFDSEICSGQLVVLCRVGTTKMTIYQESFTACTKRNAKSSGKDINQTSDVSILVVFGVLSIILVIIIVGLICLGDIRQLPVCCACAYCMLTCTIQRRQRDYNQDLGAVGVPLNSTQANLQTQDTNV